jgi:lycopene cyclase domain-containing protein
MMYSYPLWLLLFLVLPLALLWILNFRTLIKHKVVLVAVLVGCLAVSVPWDILSVEDHIWYFSEPHIVGVWLWGLPVEEYVYISFVALLASSVTILVWERYGVKQ